MLTHFGDEVPERLRALIEPHAHVLRVPPHAVPDVYHAVTPTHDATVDIVPLAWAVGDGPWAVLHCVSVIQFYIILYIYARQYCHRWNWYSQVLVAAIELEQCLDAAAACQDITEGDVLDSDDVVTLREHERPSDEAGA